MSDNRIKNIIVKYFSKSASKHEIIELSIWLEKPSNQLIFNSYVKTNYLIELNMFDFDTEKEKEKILREIKFSDKKVKVKKINTFFKYAAILIIALGIGFFYLLNKPLLVNEKSTISLEEITIIPGTNNAVLTLENGLDIVLENDIDLSLNGSSLIDDKLIYNSESETKKKNLQYNYLTIPKGGQFFVQLSDGTNVWLNSDSKLKYPVNFLKGESRMVELIYGEAYFDVTKSTKNYGDSFKVKTRIQEIEVLGTEFNLKAYEDEDEIITTLIEGKVKVGNGYEYKFLNPLDQSLISTKDSKVSISKVRRLFDEIAWKEGYFSFKHQTMKDIMKTLSRWYDISYTFENREVEHKSFTGVLDRESTIDQILIYIQKTNEIAYEIKDNTVIIK